jgi:hypothetical protein
MGGGTAIGDLKCSLNADSWESHTRAEADSLDAKSRSIFIDNNGALTGGIGVLAKTSQSNCFVSIKWRIF